MEQFGKLKLKLSLEKILTIVILILFFFIIPIQAINLYNFEKGKVLGIETSSQINFEDSTNIYLGIGMFLVTLGIFLITYLLISERRKTLKK